MTYQHPNEVPEKLVIPSSTMTFQEYAAILNNLSRGGNGVKIEGKLLPDANADLEQMKHNVSVYMVLRPGWVVTDGRSNDSF
jgi:hypothetical protein